TRPSLRLSRKRAKYSGARGGDNRGPTGRSRPHLLGHGLLDSQFAAARRPGMTRPSCLRAVSCGQPARGPGSAPHHFASLRAAARRVQACGAGEACAWARFIPMWGRRVRPFAGSFAAKSAPHATIMRFLLRFIGLWVLAGAFVALIIDGTASIAGGSLRFNTF